MVVAVEPALMTMVGWTKAPLPALSVAVILKVNVPVVVGVPRKVLFAMPKPGGELPEMLQV